MSQDSLHSTPAAAPEKPAAGADQAAARERLADQAVTQTFLHRAEQRGQDAINAGKKKAADAAERVKSTVTGVARGAKQVATDARDHVIDVARDTKQAAAETRDHVAGTVRSARSSVRGFFERAKAGVRSTIDAAQTKVRSTVDAAKQRTTEFFGGVRDAVVGAGTKAGRAAMDATLTTVGVAYIAGKKTVEIGGRVVDATKDAAGRVIEGAKEAVADAKAFVVNDAQETMKDLKAVANGTARAGVIAVGTTALALEAVAKLPGKAQEKFLQLAASIRDSAVEKKDRLVERSGAAAQRVNEAAGFLAKQPANVKRGFFALLAGAAEKLRQGATNAAERAHQAHEASRDAYHAKANDVIAKTQKNESKIRGMVGKFTSAKEVPATERAETPDAKEPAESAEKPEEEAFTAPEQIAKTMESIHSIEDFVASFDLVQTVRYSSGKLVDMRTCRDMVMAVGRYLQEKLPYIAPEDRAYRIKIALAPIRNSFPRDGGMRAKLEEVFTQTFNPPETPEAQSA